MSLAMVAFWTLLVFGVIWLVRTNRTERWSQADELLAQKFAAGEIDADEFLRRRELLHSAQ